MSIDFIRISDLVEVNKVTVAGTASIYLAGLPPGTTASINPVTPPDSAPSQSPQLAETRLVEGALVSFAAEGKVSHCPPNTDCDYFSGPDGSALPAQTHFGGAEHGISDLTAPMNSLVAVFLPIGWPAVGLAPEALSFSADESRNYRLLEPKIKQVFFVGDGRTSNGQRQFVRVPKLATRLYLGTWDRFGWSDNRGNFSVSITSYSADGESVVDLAIHPVISVIGSAGTRYRVEYQQVTSPSLWFPLTNFILRESPTVILDPTPVQNGGRIYRAMAE